MISCVTLHLKFIYVIFFNFSFNDSSAANASKHSIIYCCNDYAYKSEACALANIIFIYERELLSSVLRAKKKIPHCLISGYVLSHFDIYKIFLFFSRLYITYREQTYWICSASPLKFLKKLKNISKKLITEIYFYNLFHTYYA